jgi:hypothetical protein
MIKPHIEPAKPTEMRIPIQNVFHSVRIKEGSARGNSNEVTRGLVTGPGKNGWHNDALSNTGNRWIVGLGTEYES